MRIKTVASAADYKEETDKILNDDKYAAQRDNTFGITRAQLMALRLLSSDNNTLLVEQQKILLERVIMDSLGDLAFNQQLRKLHLTAKNDMGNYYQETGLDGQVLGKLTYFTFKIRRINQFPYVMDKIHKNYNRMQNKMLLDESHKLTFNEFSIFKDMVKLNDTFNVFQQKLGYKLDANSEKNRLEILHAKIKKGVEIDRNMEQLLSHNLTRKPGVLAFEDARKKSSILGKAFSLLSRLIYTFFSRLYHTSKIYRKDVQQATASHIYPHPREDQFMVQDYLYTDLYRIKIEKLISLQNQAVLKQLYGEDKWQKTVEAYYREAEKDIHDNTTSQYMGITAVGPKTRTVRWIASKIPFFGHKKVAKTDFKTVKQQIERKKAQKESLLCTEFVAYTTIAALNAVNDKIVEDASAPEYAAQRVEIKQGIVDIPISKHEDLKYLMPERFVDILKKRDCVEKVETIPEIQAYIKP